MRYRTETITDIPPDQVASVLADEENGIPKPSKVTASADGKGGYTVTAYFPVDDAAGNASSGGTGSTGRASTPTPSGTSGGSPVGLNHVIPAEVITAAQASQTKWGVPASVTIAQWALESGWGRHLPSGSNNPFGIKAKAGEPFVTASTREFIDGKWITEDQNFRKYASFSEAFDAHAQLLATAQAYALARSYIADVPAYVTAMAKVYANAPNYGSMLITIIQADNLFRYDAKQATTSGSVANLLAIASDTAQLQRCQKIAAKKLLDFDGEIYPSDGCAITLSVIFQQAGFDLRDIYMAIDVGPALKKLGWQQVAVGDQKPGDIGSTCGAIAQHGVDHAYIVVRSVNSDEMLVADNQQAQPHLRSASGKGRSPTTFFMRAPSA